MKKVSERKKFESLSEWVITGDASSDFNELFWQYGRWTREMFLDNCPSIANRIVSTDDVHFICFSIKEFASQDSIRIGTRSDFDIVSSVWPIRATSQHSVMAIL